MPSSSSSVPFSSSKLASSAISVLSSLSSLFPSPLFLGLLSCSKPGLPKKPLPPSSLTHPLNLLILLYASTDGWARYKKWLWWSRCTVAVTVLQFLCAAYLILCYADYFSNHCVLELTLNSAWWKQKLLSLFIIIVCLVAIVQCFTGSDVLRWRSFYETHDNAWKCHYREVFDNGIRETLCCLGRVKYLSVLEEDEVYSVARLLGDLVAYRASGTGHMELLADGLHWMVITGGEVMQQPF